MNVKAVKNVCFDKCLVPGKDESRFGAFDDAMGTLQAGSWYACQAYLDFFKNNSKDNKDAFNEFANKLHKKYPDAVRHGFKTGEREGTRNELFLDGVDGEED
jgi:hypothetical protein